MGFGINSWFYHSLQYRPILDCGSGQYGDVIWFANGLNIQKAYFNLGTYSGSVNFNYLHRNGAADLSVEYTNNSMALTGIVNTDGTASWTYTYDGTSSIVAISMTTRTNSSIDQWFKVKSSCPLPTCPITTGFTASSSYNSISASWNNMSSPVVSYQLTIVRADTPGVELGGYPVSTTASSYIFTSLDSTTGYYIYVKSICTGNTSSYSELYLETTAAPTTTTTTTSTTTTTTTAALVNVTLTPCYTQGAGGECTVTITSDTVLDTTITVNVGVDDDFSGSFNADVIVSVGTTVGTSGNISLSNGGASVMAVYINSITPNPSSGQNYNTAAGGACF